MKECRVSRRYRSLFKIEVFETGIIGKELILRDWIPLLFKTDFSARSVVKLLQSDWNNNNNKHLLSIDQQPVIMASEKTLNTIKAHWAEQSIEFGEATIKETPLFPDVIDEVKRSEIIERICTRKTLA